MQDSFTIDQPRYERKFLINTLQSVGLSQLIKLSPAGFREAYAPRRINNIYYDTSDFSHFRENIAGVSPRRKIRVRWYGKFEEINNPILEIKSKIGEVVTKSSRAVSSADTEVINTFFKNLNYLPVLKNSYLRQYFISADKTVRLTIDTAVKFSDAHHNVSTAPDKKIGATIVELKYALSEEDQAVRVASSLPFRLTKSSKYEQGISLCYPHLVIL